MGLKAQRFTRADGDLRTPEGRSALWKIVVERQPRHVWMAPECGPWGNFSRLNMCRSSSTRHKIQTARAEQQTHLELCREVYEYQVVKGNHFHMEQPQGSEVFDQPVLESVVLGTLKTVFDMCEVGKLRVPTGNNFLRKRTTVRTTSRELHESLDARYCNQRHKHQPIEGKIKYLGRWINLSEYAARYSNGFAKNVCWFLLHSLESKELPLEMAELCIEGHSHDVAELFAAAGMNKARRRTLQNSERSRDQETSVWDGPHKNPRGKRLGEVFVRADKRVPRVGTVVVGTNEELFRDFQSLCSTMAVRSVEICRGTDRFRLPKCGMSLEEIPLRQTFVMHRDTGEIYEFGGPEKWTELPKTRRYARSKPARVCVTVFGKPAEQASSSNGPSVRRSAVPAGTPSSAEDKSSKGETSGTADEPPSPETVGKKRVTWSDDAGEPEKRHKSGDECGDASQEGEYDEGFPPKGVAKHGPLFLHLSKKEREWIKRVHYRMGHPDPRKFASFLKDTHADPRIIAGALEYQCDTCSESQTGYSLARPAAIHAHLTFNEVVGMDVASWTNDVGEKFGFVHFLDEGTLFHLGRRCAEDSESQLLCFEETWLSWAGPPKQLYLDPATEYTSEKWLEAMQSEDIELKMTAAESHWQLGRVEAHGRVIKRMLDLMNAEVPIRSGEEFGRARLPASVTGSLQAGSHTLADSEGSEGSMFREALRLRSSARKAFVEADNCSSLRRALLRRSRPVRDNYEVGDWVLYWRKKGGNLRREHGRWYGPARVAMVEGLKVVWLTHANRLIRASPEQLRPASLREWKAVRASDEARIPVKEWLDRIGHQDYFLIWELGFQR